MAKVRFGGFVDEAEAERFRRNFPQYGATQWFITTFLKRFNDTVEKQPSLVDTVDASIREALNESMTERRDTASSQNSAGTVVD